MKTRILGLLEYAEQQFNTALKPFLAVSLNKSTQVTNNRQINFQNENRKKLNGMRKNYTVLFTCKQPVMNDKN